MKINYILIFINLLVPVNIFSAVSIENFSITTDNVQFDLTGNGLLNPAPTQFKDVIYIGAPGNTDWILSSQTTLTASVGTIDGLNSTLRKVVSSVAPTHSDWIEIQGSSEYDLTDGGNFTVSVNYTQAGQFSPGDLDPNDLIVVWGFNGGNHPDPALKIGEFTPVPEITPQGLAMTGFLGMVALYRIRKHTSKRPILID